MRQDLTEEDDLWKYVFPDNPTIHDPTPELWEYILQRLEEHLKSGGHRIDVIRAVTRPTYSAWKPGK